MRVAVLDDYHRIAHELADWGSLGVEVDFFDASIPRDQLPAVLGSYDTLVLMRERTAFPREVLEQLPQLKLLVTTGMRNASVDSEYLKARGVLYCGTGMFGYGATTRPPEPGVPSTIEVAWALILALFKRVSSEDRALRQGVWQQGMPANLGGSTLGLLGLGRLGAQMLAPARAFGMNVVAWSQNLTAERTDELGVRRAASKQELLEQSDVVSIHLVLSERSRGLIGAAEFAQMKPSAFLVNTSRGPIVDERAMVAALRSGEIAGAGLDVYDTEPLPKDHPLLELPNTVLTPHLGYVSHDGLAEMYGQVVEDLAAALHGDPIRVIV
ncbi:MAG TPA: D-2-hydroxyacid dehydrogenase family protein, partial [Solirubrobacteraceae bacterium]